MMSSTLRKNKQETGGRSSDQMENKSRCVDRAGYEGFELLGFKFEMEDTVFSMVATALFMVLFYFGLYIRQCDEEGDELGLERFN
ncbi:hypothetical protein QTP88_025335 [Uroleucon formosanum]